MAVVIRTFLPNTRCKITNEMRAFLIKLLGNKPVTSTLLYSGHLHGWNYKDFHDRCDSKRITVSLFQIEQGDCIGGYTSQCWVSPGRFSMWKADSSAFLFNLTRSRHFPSKATGNNIYCSKNYGPCFRGDGSSELVAWGEPFNGKENCRSYANEKGYNIPLETIEKGWFSDTKINKLTNQADGYFTISELEVWVLD